jgi:hypothetical protein
MIEWQAAGAWDDISVAISETVLSAPNRAPMF